ncbi:hypothetical protein EH243_07250 [Amphritea opalescens]|uniref:DUF4398 domain-containing protein n=1 Tax=Amphritea opalescens TaxID=2490544 RepID=A0A430KS89_9GAMM|nr:hypothetical protein [Amphritea opalescens]RTE66385.1 hypothetical protein EH243_07250 [Amphritea opalescens]
MSKALFLTLTLFMVSGCQTMSSLSFPFLSSPAKSTKPSCLSGNIDLWVEQEQQYQQAQGSAKNEMLKQAIESEQKATLAILLSQPGNTTAQLKKSIALFEQFDLNQNPECDAEQYLLVRYHYTQAVMTLQQALNNADLERKALSAERDKLKQQIEALTRIENELSR